VRLNYFKAHSIKKINIKQRKWSVKLNFSPPFDPCGNLKVKSSHTCQSRRARAPAPAAAAHAARGSRKRTPAQESQSRNKVLKVNSRKWSCGELSRRLVRIAEVCKNPHLRFKNPAHDLKIPSHDRRFNYLINTARRRAVAHNLNKRDRHMHSQSHAASTVAVEEGKGCALAKRRVIQYERLGAAWEGRGQRRGRSTADKRTKANGTLCECADSLGGGNIAYNLR
jgi:hypothetical protein